MPSEDTRIALAMACGKKMGEGAQGRMPRLLARGIQWVAVLLSLFTASVIFLRRIFVLNRFRRAVPRVFGAAYLLSLVSGLCFWASLNSVYRTMWEQLALGVASTGLSWVVLVVIVNEDLCYPTRQQWYSLLFYLVTELSITLQVRFVLSDS
jgi:hypothetical protein